MARREQENAVRTADTLRRNAARPDGGGQGLCTIYIKGYSRPFYIDCLIRSIKRCVVNYGALVLLNDGIGPEYIAKLQADHPELDVRNSPKVEGRVIAAPATALYHERKQFYRTLDFFDPARFWGREIRKDTNDYIAFDFPRDSSLETLVSLMRGHLPDEQVDAWIDWQKDFVRIYHWLD